MCRKVMDTINERSPITRLRSFIFAENIEKEKDIWYNLLKYKSGEDENEEI